MPFGRDKTSILILHGFFVLWRIPVYRVLFRGQGKLFRFSPSPALQDRSPPRGESPLPWRAHHAGLQKNRQSGHHQTMQRKGPRRHILPERVRSPPTRCFFNIHALSRSCRPAYDASGLRIRTPQNAGPGRFSQHNHELNFTIDIFYKLCYSLLQLSATQRWLGKHWGCRLRKDDK